MKRAIRLPLQCDNYFPEEGKEKSYCPKWKYELDKDNETPVLFTTKEGKSFEAATSDDDNIVKLREVTNKSEVTWVKPGDLPADAGVAWMVPNRKLENNEKPNDKKEESESKNAEDFFFK